MTKTKNNTARAKYTLEFKLEAVRMVDNREIEVRSQIQTHCA